MIMFQKIKQAILLKEGIDEKYDKECMDSFNRLLDVGLYFLYFLYFITCCFSMYFFIKVEILWLKKLNVFVITSV